MEGRGGGVGGGRGGRGEGGRAGEGEERVGVGLWGRVGKGRDAGGVLGLFAGRVAARGGCVTTARGFMDALDRSRQPDYLCSKVRASTQATPMAPTIRGLSSNSDDWRASTKGMDARIRKRSEIAHEAIMK